MISTAASSAVAALDSIILSAAVKRLKNGKFQRLYLEYRFYFDKRCSDCKDHLLALARRE